MRWDDDHLFNMDHLLADYPHVVVLHLDKMQSFVQVVQLDMH